MCVQGGATRQAVGMDKHRVPHPVNICQACWADMPRAPTLGRHQLPQGAWCPTGVRSPAPGGEAGTASPHCTPAALAAFAYGLPSFACRPSCDLCLPIGRHLLCQGPRPSRAQPATGLLKLPGLRPLVEKWPRLPGCTVPRQAGRSRPHPSSRMKARLAAVHCRPGWCAGLWTQPLRLPPGPADGATPAVAS